MQDAVGVDVERHLDLRHARAGPAECRSSWNRPMVRLSTAIWRSPWSTWISTVVWLSSAVENTSALLGRDRGVALDQPGEHAAQGLDAQRQRRDVQQQHILDLAGQHAALDRRADRHDLVRVDALGAAPCRRTLAPSPAPWGCGSSRPPGSPRRSGPASSPASLSACWQGPTVRWIRSSTSCSNLARVSWTFRCLGPEASAVMNGRLMSVCVVLDSSHLGLLGGLLQPLQRHRVLAQVDALVLLELARPASRSPAGRSRRRPGGCRRWWT